MSKHLYLLFAFCILCNAVNSVNKEEFSEELLIRPLKDGKIMSHFQLTTQWQVDRTSPSAFSHFNLFPKSIGQIIHKFDIQELHLSFTQGRWWNDRWGSHPPLPAPVGVELATYFNSSHNIDSQWKGLTAMLSGIFCASMEQMSISVTSEPKYSMQSDSSSSVRYSVLPREAVCTENLTPWIKLLPCRNKGGISALLKAPEIYDVHYHSMGLHFRGNKEGLLELTLSLTVVADSWKPSVQISACPVATESKVYVEQEAVAVSAESSSQVENYQVYDLKKLSTLSLNKKENIVGKLDKIPVNAQIYFTGYGQEFGGIAWNLINKESRDVNITFFQLLPWYMRLYLHTFKVYMNDKEYDPLEVLGDVRMIPAEDRGSPSTIEFSCTLPANSNTYFTVQFEKAFLHWTEHPPDANRGFDIGSAVISMQYPNKSPMKYKGGNVLRVYTEGLLLSLPTPDFSMPYNVITLTGFIFALFFGAIFNVLVRRMKNLERYKDDFVSSRPTARLYRRILRFIDGDD